MSRSTQAHSQEQQELKAKLDQSLLNQQYTKGQLDSLSLTVGHLGQPSVAGDAIADALKQLAKSNAQQLSDLQASNADLCNRAHAWAGKIRLFQEQYDTSERTATDKQFEMMRIAKTDADRRNLFDQESRERINSYQSHVGQFRDNYMAKAKYLRDLLMDRVPPKTSDILIRNNGQAESNSSGVTQNRPCRVTLKTGHIEPI
jgi:hypothetical protein